ncbi:RNA-directed DNA polymerase, eukaryota, reverse transcriptase zinc-binding domain protein [Tanacetum coccineum]
MVDPTEEFRIPQKVSNPGDPLSPLLVQFVLWNITHLIPTIVDAGRLFTRGESVHQIYCQGDHGKLVNGKVSYSSIWLDIVKEVDLLKKRGLNLLNFVNKKVGNGLDTLFWEESWHGDVAFKFLFPRGGVSKDQFDSPGRMVKLDKHPTRLNISRRGMDIDSILCPTCGKAVESTRHIFFTCQIARDILYLITNWWNIPYMEVSSYEEWLVWILSLRLSIKHKRILRRSFVMCVVAYLELPVIKLSWYLSLPSNWLFFDEDNPESFY